MARQKRRTFSAEFKFETVIEGLRGEKSAAQICREREINENLLSRWKQEFLQQGAEVFGRDGNPLPRINDNTPVNDGSIIRSAGITAWAGNASCAGAAGANAGESSLANDPYLIAANSGWCSFT